MGLVRAGVWASHFGESDIQTWTRLSRTFPVVGFFDSFHFCRGQEVLVFRNAFCGALEFHFIKILYSSWYLQCVLLSSTDNYLIRLNDDTNLLHWSRSAAQMIIPEEMAYETEIASSSLILMQAKKSSLK